MKKQQFIEVVEGLITDAEQRGVDIGQDVLDYLEKMKLTPATKKVEMTDNGKNILTYMQENYEEVHNLFKSKDIAEGMFVSSRSVSGAMRKLVTDGYVDKTDDSPIVYSLTEEGKTYSI